MPCFGCKNSFGGTKVVCLWWVDTSVLMLGSCWLERTSASLLQPPARRGMTRAAMALFRHVLKPQRVEIPPPLWCLVPVWHHLKGKKFSFMSNLKFPNSASSEHWLYFCKFGNTVFVTAFPGDVGSVRSRSLRSRCPLGRSKAWGDAAISALSTSRYSGASLRPVKWELDWEVIWGKY